MRLLISLAARLTVTAVLVGGVALAQSPASNKAFFAKSTDEIVLTPLTGGDSAVVTLFEIPRR